MEKAVQDRSQVRKQELSGLLFRRFIVYPDLVTPITFHSPKISRLLQRSFVRNNLIWLTSDERSFPPCSPVVESLGTVCRILNLQIFPEDRSKVLLQGLYKGVGVVGDQNQSEKVLVKRVGCSSLSPSCREVTFLQGEIEVSLRRMRDLGKVLSPLLFLGGKESLQKKYPLLIHSLSFNLSEQQELLQEDDHLLKLKKIHRKIEEELLRLGKASLTSSN